MLPMDEEPLRQHDIMERAGHDFGARDNWFESKFWHCSFQQAALPLV